MTVSLPFASTAYVLERLSGVDGVVLIGGQALNYWCDRYLPSDPQLEDHGPFASKDVDFQMDRATASQCAMRLGGTYTPIRRRDAPTTLGIVTFKNNEGVEHTIDFLQRAVGPEPQEVLDFSIEVMTSSGHKFRVMHPVHCLESRVHNVIEYPGDYDNPHGLKQARASIICARAFVREVAVSASLRAATALAERIFRFSKSREARGLHARRQIEVFDAVPHEAPMPELFCTQRYPRMLRVVQAKRRPSAAT